ncbi:MAG: hypothetical protein DSM107014_05135 [Gomphosphaeria aponina SAG 52.96 = DSM 107014]|uniref:Uncharacterized protein n=1 Tax=Gomphosphaeria aponina SAG 52.96 = DSM 107014 TaxID=1521640 RepID=A0A941JLM8_9CHRO|nr:hypothetical protein [Gomphosphaeria aponina SAG 52.96 = DSM 107014]
MANSTISPVLENEREVWESLKGAIALSSGFKRWQQEHIDPQLQPESMEYQVRLYLRETLATLAY